MNTTLRTTVVGRTELRELRVQEHSPIAVSEFSDADIADLEKEYRFMIALEEDAADELQTRMMVDPYH